jgi:hypothetical protein
MCVDMHVDKEIVGSLRKEGRPDAVLHRPFIGLETDSTLSLVLSTGGEALVTAG